MITEVEDKRVITVKDVNTEFEGRWVLLYCRDFPPAYSKGYVVAHGDGAPDDYDTLHRLSLDKYDGQAYLLKGHIPKEHVIYGLY